MATRTETDTMGALEVPADAYYGAQTARSLINFPIGHERMPREIIRAFGILKKAAALTNAELGELDRGVCDLIARAADEVIEGELDAHFPLVVWQTGSGTQSNMNVNEVLANRALDLLGRPRGDYAAVSPADLVNLHQSTNDTFPTALRIAAIWGLRDLEPAVTALQEAFQAKEREFAHVVKVGRTEYQDAVLTTLGREMGAYAEALSRDRWRLNKCEERLRVVNLGGTAIGTGVAAPRDYIFRVVDALRDATGLGLARAENLVEATQNADVFVEVSGLLKALAATLIKTSSDLRLMSSGPEAGLGELRLPARQAGSSIMPGKVNPVVPEAVTQAALLAISHDQALTAAAAMGSLELNAFLPLVAHTLLESLDLLSRSCDVLRRHCVAGIEADEARCRRHVESATASATALLPLIGYDRASALVRRALETGRGLKQTAVDDGFVTAGQFDACTSPEAVCRLGFVRREGA